MAETIATRAAYGESLVALAEQDPALLVLDADLSSATMTKNFSKAYPDRFFNMGIAECNMIGVARRPCRLRQKALCQHLRHVCRRPRLGAGA